MNQTIGVNITPQSFQPTLHYSQGDVGRVFVINVTDYDIPTGATVTCVATKPSGMGFTVSGTVSGNSVTFTSTAEMTDEWGRFPAEIRIASGNTLLGTANFLMKGEKDPHPASTIDGTQEELIPQLTLLVNRVEAAAESVHDLTVSATTLTAGSDATATYDSTNNSIAFGIPRGADGDVTRSEFNDLKSDITHISEVSLIKINDETLYNANAEFEQGNFASSGESANDYWIRTPSNKLLENGFTIYNPDGLRWALGVYDRNGTFKYYATLGSEPTSDSAIFTDKICKIDYLNDYKYRLRVARTTYVKLSPAQNTLKVYRDYVDKNDVVMKSRYRKPTITLTNAFIYHKVGSASGTEGAIYNSDNYRVSDLIRLREGETIRAYGGGAATVWLMAEFNSSGTFIQGLKVGDRLYHIYEYTADHDMYVKICGQVTYYSTGQNPVITADNLTDDTIIYYESDFYSDDIKSSPLYGKTITGMGDSLMYGSITGNDATWLHLLALKYNMTEHNLGINGNAFTHGAGSGTPMSERYSSIPSSDIIVVEGGANDKNSNVPIGTVTDTENTTFAGALNTVITGIRAMYPKATLLFLTDYNRYPSHYRAYANMMIEVCKYRSVPVFDNVSDANVALTESSMAEWQDEGLALTGTANLHFSPECYKRELLPKYEAKLLSLLGV